jgi:pimeloyl-ACP methyl ester carboxylesterase
MRLFLELDAHSVFHLLPDLDMPAFIVSGAFDLLTPARQSFDMQWRMPNAQHRFLWRSSHFSLLERPDVLLSPIAQFLDERAQWKAPVAAAAQAG